MSARMEAAEMFGVAISNLSSQATEHDVRESFSFCGPFVSLSLSSYVHPSIHCRARNVTTAESHVWFAYIVVAVILTLQQVLECSLRQ